MSMHCFFTSDLIVLKHSSTCQILMLSPTLTGHQLPNTILYLSMHDICCLKLILWCACFCECFFTCLHSITFKSVDNENWHQKLNCEKKTASWIVQNDQFTHCISVCKTLMMLILKCLFPDFLYHIFSTKKLIPCLYFNLNICHTHMYLLTVLQIVTSVL